MDFKQLEIFAVLVEELHFARTAKRCHMTASAVTRSIQRLEGEVGRQLLLRSNRSVELTQAGISFAEYARDCLEKWRLLQAEMALEADTVSGRLKVYGSVTASYSVLSKILPSFRQAYSDVEIMLHTGDQANAVERVLSGQDDMAIAAMPEHLTDSIAFKTLTFSPLRFIMPAEPGPIVEKIEHLEQTRQALNPSLLPMIVAEQGLARNRLDAYMKEHGLKLNIYASVSGHEAIISMVALGFGIGLVPEIVIHHSPLQDKICVMEDMPELQAFQIGVCVLKQRLALPVVKAFWDLASDIEF
ncbi:MAG: HTH-type transcriptional activator IlvY [Pseudomonadales bacterium]|nr:HTH-type transcriptional activator IlvY [Pseudomonadales bacterium]